MACKIAFIGAGSFIWTERLVVDLFAKKSLRGSSLVMVDINLSALKTMHSYCTQLNERMDAGWQIQTADMAYAMDGADYVVVSISTGGLDAFNLDYHIPEKYGVYHSVGDTVGPGGISRTLRNIPVFVDFAREIKKRCPDAWMVHVTNPLAQITRGMYKAVPSIKAVGLCHNYEGTMVLLSKMLGVKREDMQADTFGVNHFTFLDNITCCGNTVNSGIRLADYLCYEEKRIEELRTQTTDDEINAMTGSNTPSDERLSFELYEMLGYMPVGGPPHVAENFPYYMNNPDVIKKHHIRRKGVLPNRREGYERKKREAEDIVAGRKPFPDKGVSHEAMSDVIESLHTGIPCRAVVNLPNKGQIENLPRDIVVETWAKIEKDTITPEAAGPVPQVLKGFLESIIAEEELAVEAALTGDRQKVIQAMLVSPLLQNKDAAETLTDELLEAHRAYLPQFFNTGR